MTWYKIGAIVVASLFVAPALITGGGFILGFLLAVLVLATLLGLPKWWQYYNNKSLGAKNRDRDVRDFMSPQESSNDQPRVERADGEEP